MIGALTILGTVFTPGGPPDTGWTFYVPFSTQTPHAVTMAVTGDPHRRLLLDPHRAQHDHDGAPAAGAGHEVVAPAPVRLVDLRDRLDSASGHPDARHHPGAGRRRAPVPRRSVQCLRGGRPPHVPAYVLDLFPPGGLHHGPAGDGHRLGDHRRLFPQTRLRLLGDGRFGPGDRRGRLPGLGPPHVRQRHERRRRSSSSPC